MGMNYCQRGAQEERRAALETAQAQQAWAADTFAGIVGTERDVQDVGRCKVLSVDPSTRTARVLQTTEDYEQEWEVPFRAILI